MRLTICAVGKLRSGPMAALCDDYIKRASVTGRGIGFGPAAIKEVDAPKSLSGDQRKTREGELLLAAAPSEAVMIVLDEHGKDLSSADFAALLAQWRTDNVRETAFLIGGADGHGPGVKAQARKTIAFGTATWPHMLVRVMLCEQLYRAMSILSGQPYHRA